MNPILKNSIPTISDIYNLLGVALLDIMPENATRLTISSSVNLGNKNFSIRVGFHNKGIAISELFTINFPIGMYYGMYSDKWYVYFDERIPAPENTAQSYFIHVSNIDGLSAYKLIINQNVYEESNPFDVNVDLYAIRLSIKTIDIIAK